MKKSIVILTGLFFIPGLCFGAESTAAKMSNPPSLISLKVVQGTIDAVNLADPAKKLPSDISMKADNGTEMKFLVTHPSVMDTNNDRIQLTQLKAGDKAKVQNTTNTQGKNKAQTITLVK